MQTDQVDGFKIAPWSSLPLAVLVVTTSYFGIFMPNFYAAETPNWQAQSIAQDWVDLALVVPALVLSSLLSHSYRLAQPICGGTILFLLYTFTIYSFDVHFNSLFVIYCLALGLSFYSFLYYLYKKVNNPEPLQLKRTWARLIGIYFITIAVAFYLLWLSEIVPSIVDHQSPDSLQETGLPTNAVHVLDLSVLLPGLFFTGVSTVKGRTLGLWLAPVFLSFFILMDISIAWLAFFMWQRGLTSDLSVTVVMGVFACFSLIVLILYHRNTTTSPSR